MEAQLAALPRGQKLLTRYVQPLAPVIVLQGDIMAYIWLSVAEMAASSSQDACRLEVIHAACLPGHSLKREALVGVACRCSVAEFKRDSDTWRRRTRTAAALRQEFAELLADGAEAQSQPQPAAETAAAEQLPAKKRTKRKQSGAEAAPAGAAAEQPPAKKRTKREIVSSLTEAEAQQLPAQKRVNKEYPVAEAEAAAEQPPAKKRKKRKQAGAEPLAEAAAEQPPAKQRKKRKNVGSQTEAEAAAQQLPVQTGTQTEAAAAAEQAPAKKRKKRKQAEGEAGADVTAEQLPVREGRWNYSHKEAAGAAPDVATEQQPTKKSKAKGKSAKAGGFLQTAETAAGQPAAEPPLSEPPAAKQRLREKQKAQLAGELATPATDHGTEGVLQTAEVQKLSRVGPRDSRQIIAASTQNGVLTSLEVFEDRTKPSKSAKKVMRKKMKMREKKGA